MIFKSYLVEENLDILKKNLTLLYGENIGLINELKSKIKNKINKEIIKYDQIDILKDYDNFFTEINNISLFGDQKFFFVQNVNDKILPVLENILTKIGNNRVFLFSDILEKKSKLRIFFEKNNLDTVPCYLDNELTIKKKIFESLKNYNGLNPHIVDTILNVCGNDRSKLNNELEKIKNYFLTKQINLKELSQLLNIKEDQDFNLLRDSVLSGNKVQTNLLLNNLTIENDKINFYLAAINNRLHRILELKTEKLENIENAISKLKPPIFWKDKPNFLKQAKIWSQNNLKKALNKSYDVELKIKSSSTINPKIIFKNYLIEICLLINDA